jgi:hypothetical protein
MLHSYRTLPIDQDLYLHGFSLPKPAKKTEPLPTHHVAVIDCSGSMSGELPELRKQLAQQLPFLLSPGDFFSLIWFSGRSEAGVALDHVSVKSIKDIDKLQKTLEKWLRPIGMTGFVEPALLAENLLKEDLRKSVRKSLLFLSDGCENQSSKEEVFSAFHRLAAVVDTSVVVEYGYYADRAMLGKLAALTGGSVVLSKDLADYNVIFGKALSGGAREPLVEVVLPIQALGDVVFTIDGDAKDPAERRLRIFEVDSEGHVFVPEGCSVDFLSRERGEGAKWPKQESLAALHAALAVFGHRMEGKIVRQLLMKAGNLELAEIYPRCFGKQRYAEFVEKSTAYAACLSCDPSTAFPAGDVVFEKDALTVPELLGLLVSDPWARFLPYDPMFEYTRMSRAREDASDAGLTFVRNKDESGVPFLGLTWHEERANVSALVSYLGTVSLGAVMPEALKGKLPDPFPTKIFRNYNFVRDGIINIDLLPVLVHERVLDAIMQRNKEVVRQLAPRADRPHTYRAVLDLRRLATTNWEQASAVSARDFFLREYALHQARSRQKVFRAMLDEAVPEARGEARSEAIAKLYGTDAAAWLRTVGITDNGFSPLKTKQAAASDVYEAQVLQVAMDGMNSLPSWKEFQATVLKGGSIKPRIAAMHEAYLVGRTASPEGLKKLLEGAVAETRRLLVEQARTRFTILTGQVWFSEATEPDRCVMTIEKGVGLPGDLVFDADAGKAVLTWRLVMPFDVTFTATTKTVSIEV